MYGRLSSRGFRDAPFMEHLGVELEDLGPGWCEARLRLQDWHLQQTGVAHAGVVATLPTIARRAAIDAAGGQANSS